MKKTLKAIWQLMRLEHGLMIAIAILVGAVIAQKTLPPLDKFIFTFITALFLEASTFALNDYFDVEIDRKNKRMDRPLVRGDITPEIVLYLFIILFPLGIICSYAVNKTCFLIALITAIFAILYDAFFKKIKLVGNFFIAYIMAIPFVFGGAAVLSQNVFALDIPPQILIIALIAFLAGAGREIMKDIMDYPGDKQHGVRSFPRYIGTYGSHVVSAVFYILAVILSFFPYFFPIYSMYYQNMFYFGIIFVCDTMLLSTSLQLLWKKTLNLKYHRRFTLVALFIGLLAFLVGAFTG